MKNWILSALLCVGTVASAAPTEVRLAVHNSFDLPKEVIAQFEQAHDAKVSIIKAGKGNEMLSKLILTRDNPIADAVFGLDNANVIRAEKEGILAAEQPESRPVDHSVPAGLAIDYGFVTINYDKNWFVEHDLPLPKTLNDLTDPKYKNLLAVQNPSTSTAGLAFLLANIDALGEEEAFQWWAKMRENGVKVGEGWSDVYYNSFTQNGGAYPLVVSYATSPAAEVFYSKGKYQTPPTGNLFLTGGTFQQVEIAAVLKDAQAPELAAKLLQFLQSPAAQEAIPTAMWVYPAVSDTTLPEVFQFAERPEVFSHVDGSAEQQQAWVNRWIDTVIR